MPEKKKLAIIVHSGTLDCIGWEKLGGYAFHIDNISSRRFIEKTNFELYFLHGFYSIF